MKQKKHYCGVIGTPTRFLKTIGLHGVMSRRFIKYTESDRLFFIYLEFPRGFCVNDKESKEADIKQL